MDGVIVDVPPVKAVPTGVADIDATCVTVIVTVAVPASTEGIVMVLFFEQEVTNSNDTALASMINIIILFIFFASLIQETGFLNNYTQNKDVCQIF
jgi:hypothetical protein